MREPYCGYLLKIIFTLEMIWLSELDLSTVLTLLLAVNAPYNIAISIPVSYQRNYYQIITADAVFSLNL